MLSVCEWGVVTMKCSAHGAWACFVQGEASFEALKKSSFQLKRKKKKNNDVLQCLFASTSDIRGNLSNTARRK